MRRKGALRIALFALALAMLLPGLAIFPAKAEASIAIGASVATQGIAVSEGCTLRMEAGDASCPMPGGKTGGSYDLVLSKPGTASFPAMTFTAPGNFAYTIRQLPGSHPLAVAYDDAVYDLRVQVRDAGSGLQLAAIMNRQGSDKKAASADFTIRYIDPATSNNPPVRKVVKGDAPSAAATFSFRLKPVSNTAGLSQMPMPEGSANGVKTISATAGADREFGEMEFSAPGQYVYEVTEVNEGQEGYKYDTSVYTLTYTVEREGDALTCAKSITLDGKAADKAVFEFTNVFVDPSPTATAKPTATATAKPTATTTATPSPTPKPGTGGGGGGGATSVPTTDITGKKVWDDQGNAKHVRPGHITIHLLADGVEVDAKPVWTRQGNEWTFTFPKQRAVDSSGRKIDYTVTEDSVPYYTTEIDGMTITNTLEKREPTGYTEISGKKTWSDDGKGRPGSITIRLLRDGESIDRWVVTEAAGWRYTFSNLPVDNGYGHTYTYTIREDSVKGYFQRYDGYDVLNTRLTQPPRKRGTPGEAGTPDSTETSIEDQLAEDRHTGTPVPCFRELTEEELEALLELWGYRASAAGRLLNTGDELPWWVLASCAAGALALALLFLTRKKRTE